MVTEDITAGAQLDGSCLYFLNLQAHLFKLHPRFLPDISSAKKYFHFYDFKLNFYIQMNFYFSIMKSFHFSTFRFFFFFSLPALCFLVYFSVFLTMNCIF